jgi:hypothetical protein
MELRLTEREHDYIEALNAFHTVLTKEVSRHDFSQRIPTEITPGANHIIHTIIRNYENPKEGDASPALMKSILKDAFKKMKPCVDEMGITYYSVEVEEGNLIGLRDTSNTLHSIATILVNTLRPTAERMEDDIRIVKQRIKMSLKKYGVESKLKVKPRKEDTQWVRLYNAALQPVESHVEFRWMTPVTLGGGE